MSADERAPELPDELVGALRRIERAYHPTDAELDRIGDTMWSVLDADLPVDRWPDDATLPVRELEIDQGEHSPGLDPDEPLTPPRWSRGLVAAAAVVLLVGGVGALAIGQRRTQEPPPAPAATPTPTAPGRADELPQPLVGRSAILNGLQLDFDVPVGTTVSELGGDALLIEPDGASEPADMIILGRPTRLFDGQPAEEWFDEQGLVATALRMRFDDSPADAWFLRVPAAIAEQRGCSYGEECIALASLAATPTQPTVRADLFTDIRVLPVPDDGEFVVMVSHHVGPPTGISNDPASLVRDAILGSLAISEI